MFTFNHFLEYTEQRIRYNENIQDIEEFTNFSLDDLKQYPPQKCALPTTPTLRAADPRNYLRRYTSGANLRISKTKQRDYIESASKWVRKKYKKLTTKKQYEENEESFHSDEWETDTDYEESDDEFKLDARSKSPIAEQRRIMSHSPPLIGSSQQQTDSATAVSELLKGPAPSQYDTFSSVVKKRRTWMGRMMRKKDDKYMLDEGKRLKVCISALMQMRFHDQLAYSGLLSSMTLYMRTTLEMDASTVAIVISIWTGLCYLTPLISAYLADAKWGRAKTLIVSQYVFFVGMSCIAISTYFGTAYVETAHTLFWVGMFIVSVGFGGFKPTLSPLGADQFNAKFKRTAEQKQIAKEKRSSFFGWLYWANQLGGIVAASVIAYICQNINISIGWSLASIALLFAISSFYSAKNYFICVPPESSIFIDVLRVMCATCKLRCKGQKAPPLRYNPSPRKSPHEPDIDECVALNVNVNNESEVEHDDRESPSKQPSLVSQDSDFINLGPPKPSLLDWSKKSHGGEFEDRRVEDIKKAADVLPALLPFPVAYIIYTNLLTLVYSQGCQMNVHMGNSFIFPISSLSLISTITIIIFVPFTEKILYPFMNSRASCCNVTPLRKMGCAFTSAIIAMLISGVTEIVRKSDFVHQFDTSEMESPCGGGLPVSDMNILWQAPQFFLLGMSRVLINTGAQDFFYSESPKSMKSTLFSVNYAVDGIGAMLGSVSILLVNSGRQPWITNNLNNGHLERYFFMIGAIMCVLFALYLVFAQRYSYKTIKKIEIGKKLRGK